MQENTNPAAVTRKARSCYRADDPGHDSRAAFLANARDQQKVIVGPDGQQDDGRDRDGQPFELDAEDVLPNQHGQPHRRAERDQYRALITWLVGTNVALAEQRAETRKSRY